MTMFSIPTHVVSVSSELCHMKEKVLTELIHGLTEK
jgi:hypothetical protein